MTDRKKPKKYVSPEGDYLTVDTVLGEYRLIWYIKDENDMGDCVRPFDDSPEPKESRDAWDVWQASRHATPMSDGSDDYGLYFDSESRARKALRAVNEALLNGEAPWPLWAVKAKEAGWTMPEGWKP